MADTRGIRPIAELEEPFFLIGEWRGRGRLNFHSGPEEFGSILTCLKSPDGDSLEIIQFDDNPATERMFYAEHIRIFLDRTAGRDSWSLEYAFHRRRAS